jgi:uncharacterized protein YndB with AHSA1/START domain
MLHLSKLSYWTLMIHYSATTEINAPVDAVFQYVADLSRHHEWAAQRIQIDLDSSTAGGIGAKASSRAHQFGRVNTNRLIVTELSPPRRLAFEVEGREGHFRHSFDLTPVEGGTRVTKNFDVFKANFPVNLLQPVFHFTAPRTLAGDLRRIKARLEQAVRS